MSYKCLVENYTWILNHRLFYMGVTTPAYKGHKIEKTDHVFDKGGIDTIKTERVNGIW